MEKTRRFVLAAGIVWLVVGVAGFVPMCVTPTGGAGASLWIGEGHGLLLGALPVNALSSFLHLLMGIWAGVAAWQGFREALFFLRQLVLLSLVLAVMGMIGYGFNTAFGLMPLGDVAILFHGATAVLGAVVGWKNRLVGQPGWFAL